jgi:UDP-N-acetylglucosamine 2-epimerase
MTVVGTRPEIIRLSCTLQRLDRTFDHTLVHTGQNYDHQLSQVFFDELGLRAPDRYLAVDTSSLARVLGGTLIGVEEAIAAVQPDALLVLGDTNSSIAAVIGKRMQVPVYHMEAGNRCFDANVPEETNRRLVDHVADFNLVYTEHARRNLLAEGLPAQRIMLTGSPMAEVLASYAADIGRSPVLDQLNLQPGGYLLVSVHRQENVDDPDRLLALLETLDSVHRRFERPVLVSTHPRTEARLQSLGAVTPGGIQFRSPFGFFDYVTLQRNAYCVLSDSGTISEEAAILNFPAVTLRESTERPEALETASMITSGLDPSVVCDAINLISVQRSEHSNPPVPLEYTIVNCAQRVANFLISTASSHHTMAGIRRVRAANDPSTLKS